MEPTESSETTAYINTLTPGTYPKEKKLQSKHGESSKSRAQKYRDGSDTRDAYVYIIVVNIERVGILGIYV